MSLCSYENGGLFFIEIENKYAGNLKWQKNSDLPATAKKEVKLHGIGLDNIRRAAKKYGGDIEICAVEIEGCKKFQLTIMLYKKI